MDKDRVLNNWRLFEEDFVKSNSRLNMLSRATGLSATTVAFYPRLQPVDSKRRKRFNVALSAGANLLASDQLTL